MNIKYNKYFKTYNILYLNKKLQIRIDKNYFLSKSLRTIPFTLKQKTHQLLTIHEIIIYDFEHSNN